MAKKDFDSSENIDHAKNAQESASASGDLYPKEENESATTDVKNAHAAGDGSYGRSEKLLSDDEETEANEKKNEPPY